MHKISKTHSRYRWCYMAAWKYKISLRVLKTISQVRAANEWNIFLTQEEKFCISKWSCNVLLIIETPMKYKTISLSYTFSCCTRCNSLCSHSNSALFIVKITCYFDVYLYNAVNYQCGLHWATLNMYSVGEINQNRMKEMNTSVTLASLQTSFGVCLSRIHFFLTDVC